MISVAARTGSAWGRLAARVSARLRRRRVPFVQQLAADDCGASCLAMVLGAHGVHEVAAECRRLCGSGRDGTRARRLVEIAAHFGLSARTVAVEARELADHPRPAILHWRSSHFVVLERFHRGGVDVVDPAIGRVHMSMAEFLAGYSGVAILCEPAEGIVRTSRPSAPRWMDYLSAMFHDLRARGALAQIVAGSATLQAVGLTTPVFTKLVVDDVSPRDSTFPLAAIGVGMALVVAARGITAFTRSLVMLRLQTRLDARLTEGFFDHLLRLPYRFFQGRSSGDLLMRLSSNAMIRELLTAQLLAVLLDGPFAVVYLLVLLALAPSFALLVVALAIVQALLVLASLRPLRDLSQRALASKSDEQSCLVELMKGIVHLKAAGAERQAYERWQALFRRQLGVLIERGILTARIELALGTVRAGAPLVLLWYGASLVMAGHLGLGTMLALTAIAASFLTPFMSLVQNAQQLQLLDAYVERLADVLQADVETTQPLAGPAIGRRRLRGAIEARGLSFRFSPDGPLIVDDVSFAVDPGEQLGIVGPTGSGKSTILMLLLGLYRPTAGEVLFDGLPLPELDPGVVRRACGVVLQDVALFGGTIQANITLDAPGASASDVAEAARLAGLDADVLRMAMGYETRLSEDGTNLSGGQRQRVAIARALVERPDVLLLDEATSHLDVASEQRVIANLDALRCTRVVIAHRLTAVRAATRILVLEHGRVVERGRHDELLRREGTYAALAAQQGALAGSRWPGTDLGLASARRMEHHGHRGWRASI